MTNMHYNGTSKVRVELAYLYELTRFGVKPGLDVMQKMMDALGHPENTFKSIHVTGTNGKGSTCAMMGSILREAGYRTALYTSPHLYAFNERIQIDRVPIADAMLAELVGEIRLICEQQDIHPTFFEFTTALAFYYFSRSDIDIAVIEVGMGGLHDATNVITPLVSVITNVGLDHTEYFGPTKQHVAKEKAGIIKEGVPVVIGEKDPEILEIFNVEAEKKHAKAIRVGDVVNAKLISAGLHGQEVDVRLRTPSRSPLSKGEKYAISSPHMRGGEVGSVRLPLLGSHQIENMKTAIATIATLLAPHPLPKRERGTTLCKSITAGIAKTQWEGRLQVISEDPRIIVDGAHNGDGANALAAFLQNIDNRDVLVLAAKKGKDISDMLMHVIPLFNRVIVTESSFMPEPAQHIAEKIRAMGKDVVIEMSPGKAYDLGRMLLSEHSAMVVTGSLYMVADVLAHIKQSEV
ncbi:MAG: hypothetical protein A2805_00530 [Candidatus Andersenbacteria bacterium RIFCSPHIGHO2_01_FULL_46_36]|uniref:tetrahydrofolate synthase n=1 Tax=Candidatus Andersenbacteria bacterium RIFCSPHIGHO2_12_FULL_45_11 TaxID=1797281 RepID=A0A1G1WZJ1_9BACT|nr:MAG: hypothetical protein A2805_00530 [Candidatus Andersenbacteria bacterium RIFCSPHIGHO2_01_FULL_46_36]OGY33124.1 MAG: hypothetical protein A3D99_01545 [Candidatus Andersenbacteria bacterium RIFCSPHIGHO2_12_FULL_45_11]